ncbi:MAG: hypothetical protein ACM3ME_02275 [Chloroflexota bacterium]|nr:hypothetical protein [Lentimicrobium sp.]
MVDYITQNLLQVSFDKHLFIKELDKSRRWLTYDEWEVLLEWVKEFHLEKIIDVDTSYYRNTTKSITLNS